MKVILFKMMKKIYSHPPPITISSGWGLEICYTFLICLFLFDKWRISLSVVIKIQNILNSRNHTTTNQRNLCSLNVRKILLNKPYNNNTQQRMHRIYTFDFKCRIHTKYLRFLTHACAIRVLRSTNDFEGLA